MGYVFDAMNRGGNAKRPRRVSSPAAADVTAPPAAQAPGVAPTADPTMPAVAAAAAAAAVNQAPAPAAAAVSSPVIQQPPADVEQLVDRVQQQVQSLGRQVSELAATPDVEVQPLPTQPTRTPASPPLTDQRVGARAKAPQDAAASAVPAPEGSVDAPADLAPPQPSLTLQAIEAASWSSVQRPPAASRPRPDQHIALQTDLTAIDDRLVALCRPASVAAEEYRSIRTSLLARWEQRRHLVHVLTSATPQEGKTITSLNLGLSFAELHNRRTIVVEADLRLPQFSKLLGLAESPGLLGYLENRAELGQIIQGVGENALHVIQAGGRANDRSVQLLSSREMTTLLTELRRQYDHVIIDTPPVIELADAGIIGGRGDEVLLVVRMNSTPRTLVDQAIRTLSRYKTPVAGIIATAHRRSLRRYYYRNGYDYHYRYYGAQES